MNTESRKQSRTKLKLDAKIPKVRPALDSLTTAMSAFASELNRDQVPYIRIYEPSYEVVDGQRHVLDYRELTANEARSAARNAYTQIEYTHDQKTNEQIRLPGAVGVTDIRIIEMAREVNRQKDEFKDLVKTFAGTRIRVPKRVSTLDDKTEVINGSQYVFRQMGESATNLLACYRHIPLVKVYSSFGPFPPTPLSITFVDSAVQPMSRRTVQAWLHEFDQKNMEHHVNVLEASGIGPREYLYQKKPRHYSRLKANLKFDGLSTKAKKGKRSARRHENYAAELPIVFLHRPNQAPLNIVPPVARDPENPKSRRSIPLIQVAGFESPKLYRRANQIDREFEPL